MKTTIKILALLFAVVTITSCGSKGVDQATKDAMTTFNDDWAVMMSSAEVWVTNAETEMADWSVGHKEMETMTATWSAEQKAAMQANMDICMASMTKGQTMSNDMTNAIAGWKTDGEAWSAWKKTVDDGDISQEDATKGMEEWNGKLTAAKTTIESTDANWTAMRDTHIAAEDAMKTAMAATTPE